MERKMTQELFWLICLTTNLTENERKFLSRIKDYNNDGKDYPFTPNELNDYIRILEITREILKHNFDSIDKYIQKLKEN